ncbi:MAG: carbohydrate binding family 9 domain-containing protein [Crocinitomicaceae bacterium]|nr:carbohydrate binding family 9 domain-containing protein [Crocinitomicaceae bacterium]
MNWLLLTLSLTLMHCCIGQKTIEAKRIKQNIILDANFGEHAWHNANWTTGFTQLKPVPGNKPSKPTEVAILYDQEALYVGVKCFDHPDSVSRVLSARDDFNPNLDVFAIFIDTYNDRQNGFSLGITSRGVQIDSKIFDGEYNELLNLVWRSKTKINAEGWFAELKIPYSALRFPNSSIQDWNINFGRQISRLREENTWNPVNPDLENYLLESGKVKGVNNISPPLRLAFIPFLSSYVNFSKDSETLSSFNGGMDIKYGINEAFTLDVTLLPDFGQVVFDNQVLNISPFEIEFNENRQFFTEGTELFTKSELFYSRRIGVQTPSRVYESQLNNNEYLEEIPNSVPLINASKVSGRLNNGLGIAVFNGITAAQTGKAIDSETNTERNFTISPLSNYNVLVLDQNLKNNSFLTFTNTNVWRSGDFYDANVSGLKANFNTKNNDYYISGQGVLSAILESTETSLGHTWGIETGKQRGDFTFRAEYYEESDTYDPNDLGFLRANNSRVAEANIGYRNFKPNFWNLNKFQSNFSVNYERLYAPNLFGGAFWNGRAVMVSKSFNAWGINFNGALMENNDFFEPRGQNIGEYKYIRPIWTNMGAWFSSNYQKRIAVDARVGYVDVQRGDWREWNYNLEFRFRLSNQLFLIHEWEQKFQFNSEGYAVDFGDPIDSFDGILFGNRDRLTNEQSLGIDYTITNRLGMTFRLRHYNAKIKYNSFYELLENGLLNPLEDYSGNDNTGMSAYDINYNAFTIDMLLRWVFLPGSELNFVWKNSIFTSNSSVNERYWETLNNTLQNGPINTLSLKVIYWLDSQYLKKKTISGI